MVCAPASLCQRLIIALTFCLVIALTALRFPAQAQPLTGLSLPAGGPASGASTHPLNRQGRSRSPLPRPTRFLWTTICPALHICGNMAAVTGMS